MTASSSTTDAEIGVPAVLLRISRQWYEGIDDDTLLDVTHGWWVLGTQREQADHAIAVAGGVVRGAWVVHDWCPRPPRHPDEKVRWGFDGEPAEELQHLVGLEVSDLFPPGAANPVRYVNCGAAQTSTAGEPERSDAVLSAAAPAVESLCRRLCDNPVLAMSLGSKELFHSNMLGWIIERLPAQAADALSRWLTPEAGRAALRVQYEKHHLDLTIELPGNLPLVIENKVFSLPDEEQLDRHPEENIPALDCRPVTTALLSLVDPGWPGRRYRDWQWKPWPELMDRLLMHLPDIRRRDPFLAQFVEHWAALLADLAALVAMVKPHDGEPLLLDGELVELLATVRLDDAMQKAAATR